jgi:CRP/FNR family transcriptional regulator, dissimilatory nitrate respiration regulator
LIWINFRPRGLCSVPVNMAAGPLICSFTTEGFVSETSADIIERSKLFAQVEASRRGHLAKISLFRRFDKGQTIFQQGDPCPGVYVVGSGMVRVMKVGPTGKEHVLHMAGPGHTFGEVAAIGDFDCPANAEAVAATTCVLIPLDRFRQAMTEDHPLCLEMMSGLCQWVRHLVTLMEDVVLRDATGRIARFLLESEQAADGTFKLPSLKRHVASHLNVTSETFSRTFGRLVEAGLVIELDNNRVQVVNRDRLRAMTDGPFPKI